MIQRHGLQGSGIGYVDAQLVASTLLTPGASLWTRASRLRTRALKARARVRTQAE